LQSTNLMPTKTYAQIQKEIAKLQKEADAARAAEISGVVERIQEAIEHYGLTVADLFPGKAVRAIRGPKAAAKGRGAGKKPVAAKYTDGNGKTWSGRGKRPNWFKDALAAGKTPQDLEIGASKA
jgi:DNA-binding protein H-NS